MVNMIISIVAIVIASCAPQIVIYYGTLARSKNRTRDQFYRLCFILTCIYILVSSALYSSYILFPNSPIFHPF